MRLNPSFSPAVTYSSAFPPRRLFCCPPLRALLASVALCLVSGNSGIVRAATVFPSQIPELAESAELSDGLEALKRKDYLGALGIFARKADEGSAPASFALGIIYQRGLGVEPSVIVAESFYRTAAQRGNVPAMYNLATLLLANPAHLPEANDWLTKAAEAGSGRAAIALGRLITDGPQARERAADAEAWFRKAAKAEDIKDEAAFTLSVYLDPTLAGTGDRAKEARQFLEAAANNGYQPAVLALSDALLRSKDKAAGARAAEILKKGDAAGSLEATYRLAALNREGRVIPANPAEALRLWQKAAEAGHAMSCNQLAGLYEEGKAVSVDPAKAYEWYRRAGELGLAVGQFNTGVCLENGRGTAKNPTEACVWYCQAATSGYAPAQNRLAIRYQDGQGIIKDLVAARAWLREAAQQGFEASILNYATMLAQGQGGPRDVSTAIALYKNLAGKKNPDALHGLGLLLESGLAGAPDPARALALQELAADRNPDAKTRAAALAKVVSEADKAKAAAYVKAPQTLFDETAPATSAAPGHPSAPKSTAPAPAPPSR